MDHHQQHHEHHQKEREHKKEERKQHEHAQEKQTRMMHPAWFVVLGVVLVLSVMLLWTFI